MTYSVRNTSKKTKVTLVFLSFFILFGFSSWVILQQGISIDRIHFSSVRAEKVWLQINNGIIVKVDQLEIRSDTTGGSLPKTERLVSRIDVLLNLFREIRINRGTYQGKLYTILYREKELTLTSDFFKLVSTFTLDNDRVKINITRLEVKPYSANLSGKAIVDLVDKRLFFSGRLKLPETTGRFNFSLHDDKVEANLMTYPFTDLVGLLSHFSLDQDVLSWISENIRAEQYRFNKLRLNATVRNGKLDIRPQSISGEAIASKAEVTFHPSLPPVQSERIFISYENDRLSFDLDKPIYKAKNLDGSRVTIDHLVFGNTKLDINVRTEAKLDNEILELLGTYNIHLPFKQNTGSTSANLNLIFDLPGFALHTRGFFKTGKGNWTCGDISFETYEATVKLKDNLITIDNAKIHYRDLLKANVSGTVDTRKDQADLRANVEKVNLRDGERDIVLISNLVTPVSVKFSDNDVKIDLQELGTDISLNNSQRFLAINDFNKVKPYIPSLKDFPIRKGWLNIDLSNLGELFFNGAINTDALPLSLNNEPVTLFTFKGKKSPEKLTATINDGRISLKVMDQVTIKLHDYLVTADTDTLGRKTGQSSPVPIVIAGTNSLIKLKKVTIPTNDFKARVDGSNVTFTAELDQGRILFESNGEEMSLAATDIDAFIAQDFFEFADLKGGRFSLSLKGENETNFEGFVEFSNVLIKDLHLLNTVLTYINAVPALATLSSPGFDKDGYIVDEGVVHFIRSKDLLTIQQLRTDGKTINTEAEGWVDFENDILKLDVELISLKDYSKIIGQIPWAGYVILGENGSLSTSLLITGKTEEPEITTNLPSEIIMMPVNVVKRTIHWPFRLFGKIKDIAVEELSNEE